MCVCVYAKNIVKYLGQLGNGNYCITVICYILYVTNFKAKNLIILLEMFNIKMYMQKFQIQKITANIYM